jgi:chromosome partitioning protein
MVIVFANQKGGCGKTTTCMQFANYLCGIKKLENLLVLDVDFQGSFYERRGDDLKSFENNDVLYEVLRVEPNEAPRIIKATEKVEGSIVVIDFPGRIDDDDLVHVLRAADFIVCPFAYDYNTLESTITFALLCRKLELRAKILFLPNRIKKAVNYETKEDTKEAFNSFGVVLPEISDRVAMERGTTLLLTDDVYYIVKGAFEAILKEINI